jgi:5-methyltetrahydrofolate--homocysteine methyltransferase
MDRLLARLNRGEVLVGDGAWGTMLMERGLLPREAPEAFGLAHPEVLEEIACLYLEAGADLITTNTFGASPLRLAAYGLEARTEEINRCGVEIVRRAAAGRAYVCASMGPTGRLLKPFGDTEPEEVQAAFARQVAALAAGGADLICIETMSDLAEATQAVRAAREGAPGIPVMATMTFEATPRGFFTVMGVSVSRAAAGLLDAGAQIIGSNCGTGIETMIGIAREFTKSVRGPIAIQPNAGLPVNRQGRTTYPETPAFMAERAGELLDLGVALVGGCCGTTPEHVRALRRVVSERPRR